MRAIYFAALCLLSATFICSAQLRNGGFENVRDNVPTGWCDSTCCTCMSQRAVTSPKVSGKYSMLVEKRSESWFGPSQEIGQGHAGKKYEFSASIRLRTNQGQATSRIEIMLHFKRNNKDVYDFAGGVTAVPYEWRKIQRVYTFPPDVNGNVRLFVQSMFNTSPHHDFYIDDIFMKSVGNQNPGTNTNNKIPKITSNWSKTTGTWRDPANAQIDKIRRRNFQVVLSNPPTGDFTLRITQKKLSFPLGTAVSSQLISNKKYRDVFFQNFNYAVMENEMKWYSNERSKDNVNFGQADQMLTLLSDRGIPVRGHTIYWAVPKFVQNWIKSLSNAELWTQLSQRAQNVVGHFSGNLTHWDVNNEMLHGKYFKDRLGANVIPWMFQQARRYDPNVKLFVNDYSIITQDSNIEAFKQQAASIRQSGGDVYGLGAQAHFGRRANINYNTLKQRFDRLTNTGFPLWLTELDVQDSNENARAEKLETVIRSAFSHPRVEGVLLWGYWSKAHWKGADACLWKDDWSISAAGRRWQQLRKEWTTDVTMKRSQLGHLDDGQMGASTRGFHGTYNVEINGKVVKEFTLANGIGTQIVRV